MSCHNYITPIKRSLSTGVSTATASLHPTSSAPRSSLFPTFIASSRFNSTTVLAQLLLDSIARSPSSSSPKITDCSVRYASPRLTHIPVTLFPTHLAIPSPITSSSVVLLYIHNSLSFKSFLVPHPYCLHELSPGPFLLRYSVFVFSFLIFRFLCRALDSAGPPVSF